MLLVFNPRNFTGQRHQQLLFFKARALFIAGMLTCKSAYICGTNKIHLRRPGSLLVAQDKGENPRHIKIYIYLYCARQNKRAPPFHHDSEKKALYINLKSIDSRPKQDTKVKL